MGTHKHITLNKMIQWRWKILAIPRAKHKIMQRTPVLRKRSETPSRPFSQLVCVFRVCFMAFPQVRTFHNDPIRLLVPHIVYAVTNSNGVGFPHIPCICGLKNDSQFVCRAEIGNDMKLLLTIVRIYLKSIMSAAFLSPK